MATSETLRSVIDAGRTSKRLDELSAARVIGKAARQVHKAQQKAGAGKAIGPVTTATVALAASGEVSLALPATSTLAYSAPEVAAGGAGDRRSDVFSLGVVMWEALTHQRLFDAMNDAAVKVAVAEREIKPPAELNANIPAELSAICMRALARNPADRYQSAKSMSVEIEEFLEEAGYADSDDQIAAFLADLGKPKPEKKVTLPPATEPAAALPSVLTAPTQPPSVLKSTQQGSSPGIALANALANAGTPTTEKSTTAPGMGPSTLVAPANARTATGTAPPPAVPMPPILPPTNGDAKKINPSQTVLGMGALAHAPAEPAPPKDEVKTLVDAPPESPKTLVDASKPDAPKPEAAKPEAKTLVDAPPESPKTLVDAPKPEAAKPEAKTLVDASKPEAKTLVDAAKPEAPTTLVDAPKPGAPPTTAPAPNVTMPATPVAIAAQAPAAPVLPASPRAASQPAPKPPEEAAPTTPMGPAESRPNPAAVVALPSHRDSKGGDVLAGWGWGTDSHQAITDDSDLDLPAQGGNRKLLIYLLGGGLVFTLMVVVIAFGFGGSKKKAPPKVAATQEWNGSAQPGTDTGSAIAGSADTGATVGSAVAGSADTGSAIADSAVAGSADTGSAMTGSAMTGSAMTGSAMAGSADTGSTMVAGSANTGSTGSAAVATTGAAGSAMVAKTGAAATTGPINPYPDTPETTTKTETPKKVETPKKTEPAKIAKKVETPKKTETPRTTKRVETPKTTRTETPKSKSESSKEADAAYKAGLQQFARGDMTGALASLRTSLAANPNYPPTWRGLGLVFEKLGEKDQARAAFKRYLQLAPSAGDAESIRNRLERLGS